jgi:micrococcal nuclease
MRYLCLWFFLSASVNALSQKQIQLEEVKDHIGDSVTLRAIIYGGRYLPSTKGSPTFLDVGGEYPNAPLTLVIWRDTREKFTTSPEILYQTRREFITGKIILYKGKPEIIIRSPSQLKNEVGAPVP